MKIHYLDIKTAQSCVGIGIIGIILFSQIYFVYEKDLKHAIVAHLHIENNYYYEDIQNEVRTVNILVSASVGTIQINAPIKPMGPIQIGGRNDFSFN